MARALALGNGQILVNLDERAQVRDFYYPHVGLENHVGGHLVHRLGVFTDGQLSWTDSDWRVAVGSVPDVLAGETLAENDRLAVSLRLTDLVYNEKNIFLRRVAIKNQSDRRRQIKLFFHHQFQISESDAAQTAYFDPARRAIIHYRNQRAFLAAAELGGRGFDDFSTGVFGSDGKEGTHRDAEDGQLAKNPIEHGQADSVIALTDDYEPGEEKIIYYWLNVGASIKEVSELHDYVLRHGPAHLLETTRNFWNAWAKRRNFHFPGLSDEVIALFRRSLLVIRAHADQGGGILASGDSSARQQGKDDYNYIWPRDASWSALALVSAGDVNTARRYFKFANEVLGDREYFMHKYSPDKSLGSSWHPWWRNGEVQLPIQEDETAVVLFALWRYYELSKDLEFIESVYNSLIKKTADFIVLYRSAETGLPKPSYDLWEEKLGVSTYTTAAIYGALTAAARFAAVLGKKKNEEVYQRAALETREAIERHLYDPERGICCRMLNPRGEPDFSLDISAAHGLAVFGVWAPGDERLIRFFDIAEKALKLPTAVGGLARYAGDKYYSVDGGLPGNPWLITTAWLVRYRISQAATPEGLARAIEPLGWMVKHASSAGLLPEQLNPHTGGPVSVSPLVWSHAEFVNTVIAYLDKMEALGLCQDCNPV
jgi:GH15 family glucan-1,4-alpha-glucosidase